MATGRLSAGEDNTHANCWIFFFLTGFERNQRHSVSVGKKRFDVGLISYRFSINALFQYNIAFQRSRQFRLVGCTRYLQWTFSHWFHNEFLFYNGLIFNCMI